MLDISEFLDGLKRYGDAPGDDPRVVAAAIREALERDPNRALQLSPGAARQVAAWLTQRVSVQWQERNGGPVARVCRVEELAVVLNDMLWLAGGAVAGSVRVRVVE